MRAPALLAAALLLCAPLADAKVTRYLTGNAANVNPVLAGPVLNLGGGSTDVDSAIQAMIDGARGCTGTCATKVDVVILRATGSNGYNSYIQAMNGVDSVESLVITRRSDADTTAVETTVKNAEVVFFAGGDQCDYVTLFKGTRVETAVESVYARKGAIGGTSAGMAIQGAITYDACVASALSSDILADPYHRSATFTTGFFNWPFMADTLTDTHFVARDRMGRLLGFLARQKKDGVIAGQALGIAADEVTSVVVDRNGLARVMDNGGGTGRAYFVVADHVPGAQETVSAKKALTYLGYRIWIVPTGGTFDLANRGANGTPDKVIDVIGGVLSANPY